MGGCIPREPPPDLDGPGEWLFLGLSLDTRDFIPFVICSDVQSLPHLESHRQRRFWKSQLIVVGGVGMTTLAHTIAPRCA